MNRELTPQELASALGTDVPLLTAQTAQSQPIQPGWLFNDMRDVFHFDVEPQPHAAMLAPVEEALGDCSFSEGGQKLIMIGVPRGTYKTTIFTQGVPLSILGHNPNARCFIDSYRYDVSKKRLAAARRHLETDPSGSPRNPDFLRRYGEGWEPGKSKELPWSDDQFIVARRTDHTLIDASMTASGLDRSQVGGHYDYIGADDLVNDKNSRYPEERQKVYDHILDLLPILAPNGVLVVIYTRWHTDDAYGKIKKIEKSLPPDQKQWQIIEHGAYDGPTGLFFPSVLTHEHLDQLKQPGRLGPRKFSAQYLLQPISDEDKTFNMEIARRPYFTFEPMRAGGGIVHVPRWDNERVPVETTAAWDPAGRRSNRVSDYHGITIVGCDPMERWWVLEGVAVKMKPDALLAKWCELIVHYKVRELSIEDVNQQGTWIDALARELQLRGIEPPAFHEYRTSNLSKATRIELLQPKWQRGEIFIHPAQTELFDQFDAFTPAAEMEHEDIIDSLVQHLEIARPADAAMLVRQEANPIDPEYLARRARLQVERGSGSLAGRSGSTWESE